MARLNMDVKDSVYAEFQANCDEVGRSISDVVRQLVAEYNVRRRKERQFDVGKPSLRAEEDKADG